MSSALNIAEVARRSGFSAPTLRYYEHVGLVPPPARTAAGYRAYEEPEIGRLALIARAKAVGCSLEEIKELMPDWESGECRPVQDRLRRLAGSKLREAHLRMAALADFSEHLRGVLGVLGSHTPAGSCDADCGCLGEAGPTTARDESARAQGPVACTLDREELGGRLHDWRGLLAHVSGRSAVDGGQRLELDDTTPLAELADLVAAERACCRFFAFTMTVDDRGLALEVRAPASAQGMVDALFGSAP